MNPTIPTTIVPLGLGDDVFSIIFDCLPLSDINNLKNKFFNRPIQGYLKLLCLNNGKIIRRHLVCQVILGFSNNRNQTFNVEEAITKLKKINEIAKSILQLDLKCDFNDLSLDLFFINKPNISMLNQLNPEINYQQCDSGLGIEKILPTKNTQALLDSFYEEAYILFEFLINNKEITYEELSDTFSGILIYANKKNKEFYCIEKYLKLLLHKILSNGTITEYFKKRLLMSFMYFCCDKIDANYCFLKIMELLVNNLKKFNKEEKEQYCCNDILKKINLFFEQQQTAVSREGFSLLKQSLTKKVLSILVLNGVNINNNKRCFIL